jgi:pilus assembly protein CpaC
MNSSKAKRTLTLACILALAMPLEAVPQAAPQDAAQAASQTTPQVAPPQAASRPASQAVPQENAQSEGQALHILVGKSVVVNVQNPITRVLSSNPAVIETLATSPTEIVVEGKAAGNSSLILWDQTGRSQMLDVVVDVDVSVLRNAVQHSFPEQQIEIQADGARLILSGNITDARVAEDLIKMAGLYSAQVVNSLRLAAPHERQVLLEVKFAEVDRTKLQQLGFNFFSTGATGTFGTIGTQQFSAPAPTTVTGSIGSTANGATASFNLADALNIFAFRPDINLGATIRDLQQKSVLEILAEPNLMALNGQKASFLAGGEFPFPVVQGGSSIGAVTIQFRPFGVRLDFTGTIGADNTVRLHVTPEVSTLDFTNAVTISGFTVPALSTRRAETEIELKDGQSFGIAGLLDNRAQAQLSKLPGIGDIPILGQLFRSRSVNRSNAELMVMVTPHIVDPLHAAPSAPVPPKTPIPFLENPKFDKGLPGYKGGNSPEPKSSK